MCVVSHTRMLLYVCIVSHMFMSVHMAGHTLLNTETYHIIVFLTHAHTRMYSKAHSKICQSGLWWVLSQCIFTILTTLPPPPPPSNSLPSNSLERTQCTSTCTPSHGRLLRISLRILSSMWPLTSHTTWRKVSQPPSFPLFCTVMWCDVMWCDVMHYIVWSVEFEMWSVFMSFHF